MLLCGFTLGQIRNCFLAHIMRYIFKKMMEFLAPGLLQFLCNDPFDFLVTCCPQNINNLFHFRIWNTISYSAEVNGSSFLWLPALRVWWWLLCFTQLSKYIMNRIVFSITFFVSMWESTFATVDYCHYNSQGNDHCQYNHFHEKLHRNLDYLFFSNANS